MPQGKTVLLLFEGSVHNGWAGPSLRIRQLAFILSKSFSVIVRGKISFPSLPEVIVHDPEQHSVASLLDVCDIVLARPGLLGARHFIKARRNNVRIVTDLYCPQPVEGLDYFSQSPVKGASLYRISQRRLRRALRFSDYFITSSSMQRTYWLGALTVLRNLPLSYASQDRNFKTLAGTVPFGVDRFSPPFRTYSVEKDDTVNLIWGGGLWSWSDPLLLLRAVEQLPEELKKRVRVLFPGSRHPDDEVPGQSLTQKVRERLRGSEELSKVVCFQESWSTEEQYAGCFSGRTIGVSFHQSGFENILSWRFRIISYISSGAPVLISSGCPLSRLIEQKGGGMVTEPGNVEQAVEGLVLLISDKEFYRRAVDSLKLLRESLDARILCEDLIEYCHSPKMAEDLKGLSFTDFLRLVIG